MRATEPPGARRVALEAFYREHAPGLPRRIGGPARRVPAAVIEGACACAWRQPVRRPDVTLDARGLAWLATVATREAWRLANTDRETAPGGFLPDPDVPTELRNPAGSAGDLGELVLAAERHRERVRAFAAPGHASAAICCCRPAVTPTPRSPPYLLERGVSSGFAEGFGRGRHVADDAIGTEPASGPLREG